MKPLRYAVAIGTFVLWIALLLPACSIFTPVGDAVSSGYESTVTYFNAYYNAQRLFSEAEDEIHAAELATRGRDVPGTSAAAIPQTARGKLTTVIDKCSNILAFHPTSPLVDDALLMIGKSFFYMGEYLKSERKFVELQAQYAQSDLIPEAQFWFARCEERLNKLPEAVEACDSLISESRRSDDREREVDAELLKAKALARLGDPEHAGETLGQALDRSPSDDLSARIHTARGDVEALSGRFDEAVKDYLAVPDLTGDLYDGYYAKLQAAISLRHLKQYDRSRAILREMADDFRYKQWYSSVMFELGRTLAEEGSVTEAIDAFRIVDTASTRTDYSPRAAMELGRIFERVVPDYAEAMRYYGRVNSSVLPRMTEEARRKNAAFIRYFQTTRKLFEQDSLWQLAHDSTARARHDSTAQLALPPEEQDRPTAESPSAAAVNRDLQRDVQRDVQRDAQRDIQRDMPRDTIRFRPPAPRVVAITDPDSLRRARIVWKQELGDIFYSELEVPDSAVFWYQASMLEGTDSLRTPRVLYILGELARSNPDRGYTSAEERYRELIARYPRSEYARAARRSMGESVPEAANDSAEAMYAGAEALIDAGRPGAAVEKFEQLVTQYPSSPSAAKAEYAIAWLHEHRLHQPERAIEHYRKVVAAYALSRYAPLALRKVVMANARRDSIAADSIRLAVAKAIADTTRKPAALPADSTSHPGILAPADTAQKPRLVEPPRGYVDSVKHSDRKAILDSAAAKRKELQ